MMKALLYGTLMVILCLAYGPARAGENESNAGQISGTVKDSKTSEPISFASVALEKADDKTLVAGVITDDKGNFVLSNIPDGKYILKVTYLGYKPKKVEYITVARGNRKVNMPTMKLDEDVKAIDEVVKTQERMKGEQKIDRTVFTVSDDVRKTAASGLDVLKQIPGVSVDFQDNVELEGKSNIQFYVDGVLRNKDFVAQLNPQSIDKIEILNNPGVKYDSDVSGIINIVLKKESRGGVSGSFTIPAALPDRAVMNPNANIEYGNGKFRIYAGDRFHFERFKGTELTTTRVDSTYGNPYYFEKSGKGFNSWRNNYLNYGIDIFLNDKTSLNLLGEWHRYKGVTDNFLYTNSKFVNDTLNQYYTTRKNSNSDYNNYDWSAYFKHDFEKEGNEITAELNYSREITGNNNDYEDIYYNTYGNRDPIDTVLRSDITDNLRQTWEFKSDYTFTLKKIKNEAGVRFSTSSMRNNFSDFYTIEENPGKSTELFNYTENRNIGYYNLTGQLKKFNWQAGVRGEYAYISIYDTTKVGYGNLLPQVSVSRNFEKQHASVKFTFRKQLYRPSISDLNPFESWSDSLHVRYGNSKLRPSVKNHFELSYAKNFKNNYISPKIYLNYSKNSIQDLTTVSDKGVTQITRANVGRDLEYGVGLTAAVQLFKIWRFNLSGSVFNQQVKSNQDASMVNTEQKVAYRINCSNSVKLPKGFTFFMFENYRSPTISYQRIFSRDMLVIVGLEKQFSQKAKLQVFYNPFIPDFTYAKVLTHTAGYNESWEGHVLVRNLFGVEFSYNFNHGAKIKKLNRKVEKDNSGGGGAF